VVFAQHLERLKQRRVFDERERRIEDADSIANFLSSLGLSKSLSSKHIAQTVDIWDHSFKQYRGSGKRIFGGYFLNPKFRKSRVWQASLDTSFSENNKDKIVPRSKEIGKNNLPPFSSWESYGITFEHGPIIAAKFQRPYGLTRQLLVAARVQIPYGIHFDLLTDSATRHSTRLEFASGVKHFWYFSTRTTLWASSSLAFSRHLHEFENWAELADSGNFKNTASGSISGGINFYLTPRFSFNVLGDLFFSRQWTGSDMFQAQHDIEFEAGVTYAFF